METSPSGIILLTFSCGITGVHSTTEQGVYYEPLMTTLWNSKMKTYEFFVSFKQIVIQLHAEIMIHFNYVISILLLAFFTQLLKETMDVDYHNKRNYDRGSYSFLHYFYMAFWIKRSNEKQYCVNMFEEKFKKMFSSEIKCKFFSYFALLLFRSFHLST